EVLGDVLRHDQYVVQAELLELADQLLRLRRVEREVFDDHEALLAHELTEDRADCAAVHLAVDLLAVVTRDRRERRAAAAPDRAADRTRARAATALLLPRLRTTATDHRACLLRLGPCAASRHVRGHDLVNERLIEVAAERGLGDRHRPFRILQLKFHQTLRALL